MRKKSIPARYEADEQAALFEWAAWNLGRYPELWLMYHVPNGGDRNIVTAKRLKEQGVKPGVFDICLPVSRGKYGAMYVEMKREKGGRLSESQKQWMETSVQFGNYCVVCHGFEEAANEIEKYLRGRA